MSSTLNSLKVLSDPVRARLLHLIEPDELSVAEIQEVLGMGQSRISTHLAQLKRAGLVQDRRVGKNIYYAWGSNGSIPIDDLKRLVSLAIKDLPEAQADERTRAHVLAPRHHRSPEIFKSSRGQIRAQLLPRALVASIIASVIDVDPRGGDRRSGSRRRYTVPVIGASR